MRNIFFIIVLFSQFSIAMERMVIRLQDPSPATAAKFTKKNYDIAAYKPGEFLDIVVTQKQADEISSLGYMYTITQTENQLKVNLRDTRDLFGYRNYEGLLAELQTLETEYPSLCKLYDIGDTWGKEYNAESNPNYVDYNHEIWALKLSDNVGTEEDEPSVYYLGEHHAREPISLEVVMAILYHLVEGYGSNPEITSRVDENQIWFVPLVNPNGHRVVTTESDLWWRKNIRDNNENGSFDSDYYGGYGDDGTDLNRNYGFEWGLVGASGDYNSPVYHGPEPWSEPETNAIKELLESHQFISGITYHSYSELVLYPFGYQTNAVAPDQEELAALATAMAGSIPSLYGGYYIPEAAYDLYPCMGTTDDYSYGTHGTFSYTIELGVEFIPPAYQIETICNDNLDAAMILLDRVNNKTLTGHITDANNGEPIVATIYVDGIDNTGSFRYPYQSEGQFGRYYRFLPAGSYQVAFNAPGYLPLIQENVNINLMNQTVFDVSLEPAALITLTGHIIDAQTNLPIENAEVLLVDSGYLPAFSDANGDFTFHSIYENVYTVQIDAEGYSMVIQEIYATLEDNEFIFYMSSSIVESFESGVFNDDWSFEGHANWVIDASEAYDGIYSARSGDINDLQTSQILIESTSTSDGIISFFRKTSTESGYDFLKFYIDDILMDQWAGESSWNQETYLVSAGNHTYRWSYEKDTWVSSGEDCVWIDFISFPPSSSYPNIVIQPNLIEIEAETDQIITQSITLSNIGGEMLEYQLSVSDIWMDISALSGTISPGQNEELILAIDTQGMDSEIYSGFIHILTNDPDEPSIYLNVTLTIISNTIIIDVDFIEGWNLVGLPVSTDQTDVQTIFPNAFSETLYEFDNGYHIRDSLQFNTGYWLRFPETGTQNVAGYEVNSAYVQLSAGWNLISGISTEVSVSQIIDPDSILIPNTIYGYNSAGYANVNTIISGKGYWIRAYQDGEIIISDGITLVDHYTSECLETNRDASLEIEVNGNTMTLLVSHPELNCCLITDWDSWLENNTFFVEMNDVGPPCDCLCAFELSATFGPFESGTYTLDFWPELFGHPTFTIQNRQAGKVLDEPLNKISSNGVELLFGDTHLTEREQLQYSLPPKPPTDAADLRFINDSRICNSGECIVEVSLALGQSLNLNIDINDDTNWEILQWYEGSTGWSKAVDITNLDQISIESTITRLAIRTVVKSEIPNRFTLNPVYPNPFNPETTISFTIPKSESLLQTSLDIYDLKGRLVETLISGYVEPGYHSPVWNASGYSSGVYFTILQYGDKRQVNKMLLLK